MGARPHAPPAGALPAPPTEAARPGVAAWASRTYAPPASSRSPRGRGADQVQERAFERREPGGGNAPVLTGERAHHAPAMDHDHPIAQTLDRLGHVAREQHGCAI